MRSFDHSNHPHATDPSSATWEDLAVFRETFLAYFTEPGDGEALRRLGRLLYEMTLDFCGHFPKPLESETHMEARAALADLRQLQGFLTHLGRQHRESSLETEDDDRLSRLAEGLATELANTAGKLAAALAREEGGPEIAGDTP